MAVCAQIGVDSPILTGQTDTEYLTKDLKGIQPPGEYFYLCRSKDFGQSGVSVCPQHGFRTDVRKFETIYGRSVFDGISGSYLYTPERVRKLQVEGCKYLQADDPCFSTRESQGQDTARVTLVTCVGYFQTPKRLAVETKVVETRTAF